ncbi:unnamed protein product [Ostreobium quekettii]|uniref:PPM-type phosphatase domain-containing protein n=1 Tax=Ostreobium quekettii TaxID=121088 RepID=A0A8S1IQJ5_9CHLO|nr:unnamed protein product [Ostreobium quekettii]
MDAPPRSESASPAMTPRPAFGRLRAQHTVCKKTVNGEDVVFYRDAFATTEAGEEWSFYCMCDGHGGAGAASFVRANMGKVLGPMVPKTPLPDIESPGGRRMYCRRWAMGPRVAPNHNTDAALRMGENTFSLEIGWLRGPMYAAQRGHVGSERRS